MILEIRALWMLGALFAFGFGLLVLLVRKTYPAYLSRVLLLWGGSYLCLGLAYAIWFMRPWVGDFTFNVLSRVLVALCLSLELRAISALKKLRQRMGWLIGPPLAMFAVCAWFTAVHRNITVELLGFNIIDMTMMIVIAVFLLRKEKGKRLFIDVGAASAYGLLALLTFIVIVDFFRAGHFPQEYEFNVPRAIFNGVGGIVSEGIFLAFFLLMVSERLNRNLILQAMHDPLTGLYNRRAFEEIAFHEISGASRTGQPVSLLIFDVDCLKQINDKYGHLAGDVVLRNAADVFLCSLRDEDFLCRWGGDEFCALVPRARREQAQSIAERVLKALDELSISFGGTTLEVAVSIGIVTNEGDADDLPSLIERADVALYRANQEGRNRFTFAQESVSQ